MFVDKKKKQSKLIICILLLFIVQPIGVTGLNNTTVKVKSVLKLVCRAKGNPMPALQWFKDGVPILVGRRRIQYKKYTIIKFVFNIRIQSVVYITFVL